MSCGLRCLTGSTMILSTACHGEARQAHELWQCNPDENEQQPGDGHESWGLFGHGFFLSLPWRFSGMISCLLWDYSAWSTQCGRLPRALPPLCHGLPPAASTVFTKVSVMALPTTSSSLSCCLGELQIPDHQTRVFQNAVPTCQHFPSCLFRPSAAEFLPAPKLNHFSLSLSLPTEYWVVQALSASALSHPPLKVKWRSCLVVFSLIHLGAQTAGVGVGGSGMAHPLLW